MFLKRLRVILQYNYIYYILLIFVILLSFIRCNLPRSSIYDLNTASITGKLLEYKIDGNKMSFIIYNKEKVKCTYYIDSEIEKNYLENINFGVTIKVNGELSYPQSNTIPNTFNYKNYLKHNNINFIMNVDKLEVVNNKTSILYKIKNKIYNYLKTFKSRNYLFMFIVGNKNYLDDDVYDIYQKLGVSHIFAISGTHVGLLTTIIMNIFNKLKVVNKKHLILIIFLIFYSYITSFQPSIIRSVGLFILLYINKKYDFNIENIYILFLDISFMLLLNPNFLYNLGFIYSCTVSYSLIKYSHLIKGRTITKILKVSTIAFLFSLPISLYNNYEINLFTIFNNLIVVPIISSIVFPLSLITFLIKPLDYSFYALTHILEVLFKNFSVFNLCVPKINFLFILIYYLVLTIFFSSYNKKILIIIPIMILFIKLNILLDTKYYIYYLDVGQGDSILLKYKGESILIDTGGSISYDKEEWEIGSSYYKTDTTIQFLKSIGITNLSYLILTHGDYDHAGEAEHLIDNFKVKRVIFNSGSYNNLEENIITNLETNNINYVNDITKIKFGNTYLNILYTDNYDNENDNSLVIHMNLNNYNFLFMGDASTEVEDNILLKYNLNEIDFLKVGHHGSDTSSKEEFINSINPKYSIISVGKNNRYNHPKESVLEILESSNIYRTDKDGTIEIQINKNKYNIKTYSS